MLISKRLRTPVFDKAFLICGEDMAPDFRPYMMFVRVTLIASGPRRYERGGVMADVQARGLA